MNVKNFQNVSRLREVERGKFDMKSGQRHFRFTESAFFMAWSGFPGGNKAEHRGSRGIEDWLEGKGLAEFAAFSLTPTALARARRAKGRYVVLEGKSGGWGGARKRGGCRETDDLPDLFEECVEEAARKQSEAPYLRYEAAWERANSRKAPKRLLARFRARVLQCAYGRNTTE